MKYNTQNKLSGNKKFSGLRVAGRGPSRNWRAGGVAPHGFVVRDGRDGLQNARDGRDGLQNARDEAGTGYVLKKHLRDEARRVGKLHGTAPAGHQNFVPRPSLVDSDYAPERSLKHVLSVLWCCIVE